MKTVTILILSLVYLLFLTECQKKKPTKGDYVGEFDFTNELKTDTTIQYHIIESNKNWVILESGENNQFFDTLFKKSKKIIEGKIFSSTVVGNIVRDGSSSRFMIIGTFIQKLTSSGPGSYESSGKFTIKK